MKINSIQPQRTYYTNILSKENVAPSVQLQIVKNQSNPQKLQSTYPYRDYNVSFCGRTPENFYAQTFNRENMPDTMKEYLDYDYETRQHIPPEQMMQEVFQYIKKAKNFQEVKEIYPKEKLFNSLHENHQNNRTSILSEIKAVQDLSDEPLLKDGSNDFGMYLLKKVYLEGKTIKEINKDFHEKDINDIYKGIITKPIDSQTTSAYGIRYPKSAFWNSFIATREEYKKFFVTLPKNTTNPAVNLNKLHSETNSPKSHNNENKTETNKTYKRKYQIKDYHKKQLTNDIKDAKGETGEIEKKIRKRFAKDEPEATFIVKYLSPIMTVAAERIHLSEEMKNFCEQEKENGKTGDDEFMFKRFWKKNPEMLNYYAQTITDTIDLFEQVYGYGGLIPINKDLEIVNSETQNQKIVDNVSPEFLELLNYTQTISPEREHRYALHEQKQKEWEEHFINKYGEVLQESNIQPTSSTSDIKSVTNSLNTTKSVQELFIDALKEISQIYPTAYANNYVNYMKNNKNISDKYKIAYTSQVMNIDNENNTLSKEEFLNEYNDIEANFMSYSHNSIQDSIRAKLAIMELLYNHDIKQYKMYFLNPFEIANFAARYNTPLSTIITENKNELNQIYANYKTPLKPNEIKNATKELYSQLLKYNPKIDESLPSANYCTELNLTWILKMLKDACNEPPRAELIQDMITNAAKHYPNARAILNASADPEEKRAIFENIMYQPILDYLLDKNNPTLVLMIGEQHIKEHINNLENNIKMKLINQIRLIEPNNLFFFQFTLQDYLKAQNQNPELCQMQFNRLKFQ